MRMVIALVAFAVGCMNGNVYNVPLSNKLLSYKILY